MNIRRVCRQLSRCDSKQRYCVMRVYDDHRAKAGVVRYFDVERVPFSVDQNKSYFPHKAGGSKALIYGRPQSQFSGELFTTRAQPLLRRHRLRARRSSISSETMATRLDALRLLFCRIKKQKQISAGASFRKPA